MVSSRKKVISMSPPTLLTRLLPFLVCLLLSAHSLEDKGRVEMDSRAFLMQPHHHAGRAGLLRSEGKRDSPSVGISEAFSSSISRLEKDKQSPTSVEAEAGMRAFGDTPPSNTVL